MASLILKICQRFAELQDGRLGAGRAAPHKMRPAALQLPALLPQVAKAGRPHHVAQYQALPRGAGRSQSLQAQPHLVSLLCLLGEDDAVRALAERSGGGRGSLVRGAKPRPGYSLHPPPGRVQGLLQAGALLLHPALVLHPALLLGGHQAPQQPLGSCRGLLEGTN